jgi:hypothetical protein
MSALVKTNDALVFGPQSQFYRVITDSGLKESFFNLLINKSSKVVRKRGFETYVLANKVFPGNSFTVSETVKHGIGQLLLPFIRLGAKNNADSVLNLKPSSYIQGEISLTNELAKALKVKHILAMVVNSEKTTLSGQKGITTYITRKFACSENQALEISWSGGFFTFNDPASLSILVIIPKQYLANLMINISSLNTGTSITDDVALLESLKNEMVIDLVKSFFAAAYSDGYRHRINTDMASLTAILNEQGDRMMTSQDKDGVFNEMLNAYRQRLQGFKEDDCENLVYECLKLYHYLSHVTINPYSFYQSFIDIPYSHVQLAFKNIPNVTRLSNRGIQSQIAEPDFSNNLAGMNSFFEDSQRDIAVYGIKLIRFLPFFLFNTYVLGGGNYHSQALSLLSNVIQFIPVINNFKSTHILYGPAGAFISEELQYITSVLAKQLSSPLKVNDDSRHMVINLIARSLSPEIG